MKLAVVTGAAAVVIVFATDTNYVGMTFPAVVYLFTRWAEKEIALHWQSNIDTPQRSFTDSFHSLGIVRPFFPNRTWQFFSFANPVSLFVYAIVACHLYVFVIGGAEMLGFNFVDQWMTLTAPIIGFVKSIVPIIPDMERQIIEHGAKLRIPILTHLAAMVWAICFLALATTLIQPKRMAQTVVLFLNGNFAKSNYNENDFVKMLRMGILAGAFVTISLGWVCYAAGDLNFDPANHKPLNIESNFTLFGFAFLVPICVFFGFYFTIFNVFVAATYFLSRRWRLRSVFGVPLEFQKPEDWDTEDKVAP